MSASKAGICNNKKIVKNDLSYGGVFGWEQSKSPHFTKKCGVFCVTAVLSLEPYIHITSIMECPPRGPKWICQSSSMSHGGTTYQESSSWQKLWNRMRMHVKITEILGQFRRFSDACLLDLALFSWSADILSFVDHELTVLTPRRKKHGSTMVNHG